MLFRSTVPPPSVRSFNVEDLVVGLVAANDVVGALDAFPGRSPPDLEGMFFENI